MQKIKMWMNDHFLKINTSKTEILLFCPKELDGEVIIRGVILDDSECVRFADKVKNLGVWFDSHLNFDKHINRTTSHSFSLIKDLWKVRSVLSTKDTEKLTHSLISLKLDYCNSLLYGINKKEILKLQKVQNSAARLVCRIGRKDSISKAISDLHWLPIESRILYKIILLVHKCLRGKCSSNLMELLTYKSFTRSDTDLVLVEPVAITKYGKRGFRFIAPRLWNTLPASIRLNDDTDAFKKDLKTLLFTNTEKIKHTAHCYT